MFWGLVFLEDCPSSLYFPFLRLFGIGGVGDGAIVFYLYLSGFSVVGGIERRGWIWGLRGVDYLGVTPSPYFLPSFSELVVGD